MIVIMAAIMSVGLVSCNKTEKDDLLNSEEVVKQLMKYKWIGQSTDYDVYSYGGSIYTQTWTVYFTSEHEGVIHVKIVDRDSSLGTSRSEEHVDFSYSVDGNKIRLYGGSNFVFTYYGTYLMEGEDIFEPSTMTSSDYTYLEDHKAGYHGTEGKIDTDFFVIDDDEILQRVNTLDNGWYSYFLQFGFGAASDDAYKKGITQIRLTAWADNGCFDTSYKTSNYGKKKTYTLNLSLSNRDWYDWIFIQSKDKYLSFNYELEYYNSKDKEWYEIEKRKLTLNATGTGDNNNSSPNKDPLGLCSDDKHPHMIDMGRGLKWSCCNVGAKTPIECGDYFAWGETTPKNTYSWFNYKYCKGTEDTMTKYCTLAEYGLVDNKSELELSDDAARANLGGSWRMPTIKEFDILTLCTWKWTTINGVKGYQVIASNGNKLFFPATGYRYDTSFADGSAGHYWSSSLFEKYVYRSNGSSMLCFYNSKSYDRIDTGIISNRCHGLCVRPVTE